MAQNDGLRRYLEAGISLTQITRSRAEDLVRDLIQTGEIERNRAQDWVEDLVTSSRDRSEAFISTVRKEVHRQMADLDLDDLARRVADIMARGQAAARKAGRTHAPAAKKAAARSATAKKAPARKAPAQKAAGTTAPAKKAAAKKATTKKAPAKKAPAKKAAARPATPTKRA